MRIQPHELHEIATVSNRIKRNLCLQRCYLSYDMSVRVCAIMNWQVLPVTFTTAVAQGNAALSGKCDQTAHLSMTLTFAPCLRPFDKTQSVVHSRNFRE
jgi:hypothetical protein